MTDILLSDLQRAAALESAEQSFQMDEEGFRAFYELTARPLWAYLARMTADRRLADDLLQESYYRFLRTTITFADETHRRHYLFRIATNLVRDHQRRPRLDVPVDAPEGASAGSDERTSDRLGAHLDLTRAMEQLKPRDRSLLWLAYAQGYTHEEIAATLGLKRSSLKALLFRARQRLLSLLGAHHRGGAR